MPYRICEQCGSRHLAANSPICGQCRKKASKHKCAIDGCDVMVGADAKTCLMHRHLQKSMVYSHCRECGERLPKPSVRGVCDTCYDTVRVLCACGCGRYRRKYGERGQVYEYVSGHNDNWAGNRPTPTKCAVCGNVFKPSSRRQRLCSIECRTKWLTINPPNERKKMLVHCAVCGKAIYRAPYQMKSGGDYVCSKKCHYIIVAKKNSGPKSDTKKLAVQRDGGRCVICGFDIVIEVHHIKPRKRNGGGGTDDLGNLITLCPNHHTMADRGLLSDEELKEYIQRLA